MAQHHRLGVVGGEEVEDTPHHKAWRSFARVATRSNDHGWPHHVFA